MLVKELRDKKYEAFPPGQDKKKTTEDEMDASENDEDADTAEGGARDYDYLLSVSSIR